MRHSEAELRSLAKRYQHEERWRSPQRKQPQAAQAEQLATLARIYNLLSGSVSPEDATNARELTYELIQSLTEEMKP